MWPDDSKGCYVRADFAQGFVLNDVRRRNSWDQETWEEGKWRERSIVDERNVLHLLKAIPSETFFSFELKKYPIFPLHFESEAKRWENYSEKNFWEFAQGT